MKYVLGILLWGCSFGLFGQVKIDDQKGKTYYDMVVKTCQNMMVPSANLATMANKPIPAGMMDTLKKYDWYELGSYYFYEKTYHDNFKEAGKGNQDQFDFFRIMPDGRVINFQHLRFKTEKYEITTTTFTKETSPIYRVKKVGNFTCIENEIYGENSFITIISYQNGILVIDSPKTGKAGSTEIKRFRNVYRAVPKGFNWDWK